MNILAVASELFPLVKTGGLADVTGALPKAIAQYDIRVRTLLPGYPQVMRPVTARVKLADFTLLGARASLWSVFHEGLDLVILDCPELYERPGGPYVDEDGVDHPDNWRRFAALSKAAACIAAGLLPGWKPDLVHMHDWQSALTCAYLRAAGVSIPTVLTIHNLAFQGQFPTSVFPALELPDDFRGIDHMEYYDDICFLKAGIRMADAVTTVSPTYAREILVEDLGMGLQGVLATRRDVMHGIVNGIDTDVWNPATDPHIAANYDYRSIGRRRVNRMKLVDAFGLEDGPGAIFSVVSRLTWQKGLDLLVPVIPGIVDRGAKLIVHGQGDRQFVAWLLEEVKRYPGKVSVKIGYDEATAHLIHAGSDAIIQPSRFEPCGLTQLYALRYGAIPVVGRTGGLAETIIDANDAAMSARVATGFQFQAGSVEDLYHAIDRALLTYDQPATWRKLQTQAMKADFSWARSARHYASLFSRLGEKARRVPFRPFHVRQPAPRIALHS